jgi:hypothetical protein
MRSADDLLNMVLHHWWNSYGNFNVLYAATRPSDNAIKVGCSNNPYRRMKEFAKQTGEEITWIGWIPTVNGDDYEEESVLHEKFHEGRPAAYGTAREWYLPPYPDALVEWLQTLADPPSGFPRKFKHTPKATV